jgi:hypothetical protein
MDILFWEKMASINHCIADNQGTPKGKEGKIIREWG